MVRRAVTVWVVGIGSHTYTVHTSNMPRHEPIVNRLFATAIRRGRKALSALPLLRRMAAGDIVVTEQVLNRMLERANLDEELPLRWETLQVRLYDGYFELDLQGAAVHLTGPLFRTQARFESVEISLTEQVVRLRFLREIQTFSAGAIERLVLLVVRTLFGRLLEPEGLVKMMDRSNRAFVQEAPDLLRINLHELPPVKRHLEGLLAGALGKVLGRQTLLIHAIECEDGRLTIRTTTVAQELSVRALQFGSFAGSAAAQLVDRFREVGRSVTGDSGLRLELEDES